MVKMYVSVSAYKDAYLLKGCIESIREVLPDARIAVVDGRYETWPDDVDNCRETEMVASNHGVEYYGHGPYPDESAKHRHRVSLAPEGERILFIDADERLHSCDIEAYGDKPLQPRIINPVVYGNTPNSYWPRSFYKEQVLGINRWDAYELTEQPPRCDELTIVHRHDLRGAEYRRNKYKRFDNEGRSGRMDNILEDYIANNLEVDPVRGCPECGEYSVVDSPPTNYSVGERLTAVEVCVNGECYTDTVDLEVNEYEFLPDNLIQGLELNPARTRMELVDAGFSLARATDTEWLIRHHRIVMGWVRQHRHELA